VKIKSFKHKGHEVHKGVALTGVAVSKGKTKNKTFVPLCERRVKLVLFL
jgi:hypothetical protein